jgi:hypothetical protein
LSPVTLDELRARRERSCRLRPERALEDLDEAEAFLHDRGLLTRLADSSLPSLYGACHEEPYAPGRPGFGQYPKTKWRWGWLLSARPGVFTPKIHGGRDLYLSEPVARMADPLCRAALDRARGGALGEQAEALVGFLERAGPSLAEDVLVESGMDRATLRRARAKLEREGAVVSEDVEVRTRAGAERSATRLSTWDQHAPWAPQPGGGLDDLLVAAVGACVVAPEAEVGGWFTWPVEPGRLDALVAAGRLRRPAPGWLAVSWST